jgi:hypothetical protein
LSPAEGQNTWEQFESAVETADVWKSKARDHYSVVRELGGNLNPAYAEALDEIERTIEEFDSVYDVDEDKLEEAVEAAQQGEFLSELVLSHRHYHEDLVESRVELISKRFEALDSIQKESSADTSTDTESISKQVSVMNKLLQGEKHGQLMTSDRISIDDIEKEVSSLDENLRETATPEHYTHYTVRLIEVLREKYTDHLSWLNEQGANNSVISVSDRVQDIPDIDDIKIEDPSNSSVTRKDAIRAGEAAETHYELAEEISDRRGQFELGESLDEVVKEHAKLDNEEEFKIQQLALEFNMSEIRNNVAQIIQTEATTSTSEQVLCVLRQHDGSVRETATTLDIPLEELFNVLQQLYEERSVTEFEAKFQ